MIRVVVDDQRLVRSGLKKILSVQADIQVVGEAATGSEAIQVVAMEHPDVVLMDVEMPELDGVAATKQLQTEHPYVRVILLTTFDKDRYVFEGLQNGAISYLLKDADEDEVIKAIRAAVQGASVLHPTVATKVIGAYTRLAAAVPTQSAPSLSQREREILRYLAQGYSNQTIAARLVIAEGTVRNHLTSILSKLEVSNRTQAVARAKDLGII